MIIIAGYELVNANYDGADGWGRAARKKRAEGIKARWDLDRTPN